MRPVLVGLIRARPAPESAPVAPPAWDVVEERDGWSTVYPLGREARPDAFFHARLVGRTAPQRGIYVVLGPRPLLDMIDARIAADALPWSRSWLGLAAMRADTSPLAVAARAAVVDDRPLTVTSAQGVEPVTYGAPIGVRVALRSGMAGFAEDDGE